MKCGKSVDETEEYCEDCRRHNLAFEQGKSVWLHKGKAAEAIYRFKFHNKRYYAELFAEEMAERCGEWIRKQQIDVLIPVPLHPSKKRNRGFNQSELLAKELGRILRIPVESDVVLRVKKTLPQKTLGNREREENLQNAFGVRRSWSPKRRVLLIDDIYTTGNTIHRISKVLKQAGVQKVYFLTISIGQGL